MKDTNGSEDWRVLCELASKEKDPEKRQIALELVDAVRKNASIDWTVKESVRAKMRAIVKRIAQ